MPGAPTHVDLVRALCLALGLDDHSHLAPDLSRLTEGGGWITRDGAVRLVRQLLRDCGHDAWSAVLALEREAGRQGGYEDGWRAAMAHMRPQKVEARRCRFWRWIRRRR